MRLVTFQADSRLRRPGFVMPWVIDGLEPPCSPHEFLIKKGRQSLPRAFPTADAVRRCSAEISPDVCGTNVTSPPCCAALPRCDVQGGLNGRYLGNPPGGGCARAAERGLASWGSPWDRTGWGRLRSLASAGRFGFAGFLNGTPRSGLASLGQGLLGRRTFHGSWADHMSRA